VSPSTSARRPWTVDEQGKLDVVMEAGKTAAEIATALQRTPPPFIRGYTAFTENNRSHPPPGRDRAKHEANMTDLTPRTPRKAVHRAHCGPHNR
jgi:hypothetical protein